MSLTMLAGRTLVGAACPKCGRAQQAPAEAVVNCTFCNAPFRAPTAAAAAALQSQVNAKAAAAVAAEKSREAAANSATTPTSSIMDAGLSARALGADPPQMAFEAPERLHFQIQVRAPHRTWIPPNLKLMNHHWVNIEAENLPLRTGYLHIPIPDDPVMPSSKKAPEKLAEREKEGITDPPTDSDNEAELADAEAEPEEPPPADMETEVWDVWALMCCGMVPPTKVDPNAQWTAMHRCPLIVGKTKSGDLKMYGGRFEPVRGAEDTEETDKKAVEFLQKSLKHQANIHIKDCGWIRFCETRYAARKNPPEPPRRAVFYLPKVWDIPAGLRARKRFGVEPIRLPVAELVNLRIGPGQPRELHDMCMAADAINECFLRDGCIGIRDALIRRRGGKGLAVHRDMAIKRSRLDGCEDWNQPGCVRNLDALQDCFAVMEPPPLGARASEEARRAGTRGVLKKERLVNSIIAASDKGSLFEGQSLLSGLAESVQYIPTLVKTTVAVKQMSAAVLAAPTNVPAAIAARGAAAAVGLGTSAAANATSGLVGIGPGGANPVHRAATVSAIAATAKHRPVAPVGPK
eukprot:TRINITY_DN15759_c1_g1_i1.p1 TRINITY_DN15759_c1_g1~~TRINITY_DN15759_c1_g1_i1.p1  ORF type:complete len:610 (+),score=189.37 TRINITY_DN15759_c1_g1_i1:105-1832(+)